MSSGHGACLKLLKIVFEGQLFQRVQWWSIWITNRDCCNAFYALNVENVYTRRARYKELKRIWSFSGLIDQSIGERSGPIINQTALQQRRWLLNRAKVCKFICQGLEIGSVFLFQISPKRKMLRIEIIQMTSTVVMIVTTMMPIIRSIPSSSLYRAHSFTLKADTKS